MLQVSSNGYYIAVHINLEKLGTDMVLIWPQKNGVKTGIQIILLLVNKLKQWRAVKYIKYVSAHISL